MVFKQGILSVKKCPNVETKDGIIISDQSAILEKTNQFYSSLCASQEYNILEASATFKNMSNGPSFGYDGFTTDLFKACWKYIWSFCCNVN